MAEHLNDELEQVMLSLLIHNAVPDEEAQPYDRCIVRHFSGRDRFLHLLRIHSEKLMDLSIMGVWATCLVTAAAQWCTELMASSVLPRLGNSD